MSLLDAISAENITHGPKCTVATIKPSLSPADAADLESAFATPAFTAAAIARALRKNGHRITDNTVQRHRRGECGCK